MRAEFYIFLADLVVVAHLALIGWVIFGALFTGRRPRLALAHIATVVYGILVEATTLVCPLTLAENWCEARAGVLPYRGPFVLHYLDAIVSPNLPTGLLIAGGIAVCLFNLGVYVRRILRHKMLE